MPWCIRPFFTALSFLTCLPVQIAVSDHEVARSLGYFPMAGLVLGGMASLPVWLGCFPESPALQGVTYAACLALLTRGLHWDGFADLCDAVGSGTRGERFHAILKDSRLGAFGAMGLVFAILAHCLAAGAVLSSEHGLPCLWIAPLVGRSFPALLLWRGPVREGAGLARLFLPGAGGRLAAFHLVCAGAVLVFVLGVVRTLYLAVAMAGIVNLLLRLARRERGLNGDFLGTVIVLGELGVLLVAAC